MSKRIVWEYKRWVIAADWGYRPEEIEHQIRDPSGKLLATCCTKGIAMQIIKLHNQ